MPKTVNTPRVSCVIRLWKRFAVFQGVYIRKACLDEQLISSSFRGFLERWGRGGWEVKDQHILHLRKGGLGLKSKASPASGGTPEHINNT